MQQPKLWQLTEGILALENQVNELEDKAENSEAVAQLLEEWLGSDQAFEEKACQVAGYIKHLEALAEARKQEARRLQQLAQTPEQQAAKLRTYLLENMRRVGKQKISGILANLSLRKKPAELKLTCTTEELPSEFKKVVVSPDLTAIKNHVKTNPDCPWAKLDQKEEYSLVIK